MNMTKEPQKNTTMRNLICISVFFICAFLVITGRTAALAGGTNAKTSGSNTDTPTVPVKSKHYDKSNKTRCHPKKNRLVI